MGIHSAEAAQEVAVGTLLSFRVRGDEELTSFAAQEGHHRTPRCHHRWTPSSPLVRSLAIRKRTPLTKPQVRHHANPLPFKPEPHLHLPPRPLLPSNPQRPRDHQPPPLHHPHLQPHRQHCPNPLSRPDHHQRNRRLRPPLDLATELDDGVVDGRDSSCGGCTSDELDGGGAVCWWAYACLRMRRAGGRSFARLFRAVADLMTTVCWINGAAGVRKGVAATNIVEQRRKQRVLEKRRCSGTSQITSPQTSTNSSCSRRTTVPKYDSLARKLDPTVFCVYNPQNQNQLSIPNASLQLDSRAPTTPVARRWA